MREAIRRLIAALSTGFSASLSVYAQDTAVIGPPYRLEAAADEDSWGLEHVGAARRIFDDVEDVWRTEVIVAWMRDRSDNMTLDRVKTVRLGFTNDGGTTWTFQDFQSPIDIHEFDPMAAFDPVTESLYVGSMAGGQRDYISRLDATDHLLSDFGELQRVFSGSLAAHRPSAGAGPKPGALTENRVYVSAGFDLMWSDALGAQASWKGPITVNDGITIAVPRIGNGGELYLAHRLLSAGTYEIRLDRSLALDSDADETPLFLSESQVATTAGIPQSSWLPSNLRLTDVVGCAVAPHDGKRVYVVWMDRTSQAANGCGTTNHNMDLYFSMTTDATVASPTWTTKKIVPAGVEVAGDQFYPWLEATTYQDGSQSKTRLHLVWYDSRHMPDQCDTGATDNSFWFDAYYAYSDDEGATWNETRLTEDSMNTAHALEFEIPDFYGDYIGMAVVGKRAFPLYSIATSLDEPPSDPLGWSEVYTNMIVFGNVPSYTDFTVTEGTLQSADDLSLITSSNNQRLIVKDFIAPLGQPLRTIVDVELDTAYTGVDGDDEIDIRVEGYAVEANATGRIYLRPQPAGEWVLWKQFAVPAGADADHFIRGIPTIYNDGVNLRDFVDSNGRIDVRIEMTRPLDETIGLTSHYDFVQEVVVDNE